MENLEEMDKFLESKQPNQKMAVRPKYTFLQGKHIDGQHAHENILNIASY